MTELANSASFQVVPAGYAEKTMASLMQLHTELMDEKERRIELFQRLMEKEQALAELRMYLTVLEDQLAQRAPPPAAAPVQPAPLTMTPEPPRAAVPPPPPARVEGWKTW